MSKLFLEIIVLVISRKFKLIYLFLFETGARIGKAKKVKISDINYEKIRIRIPTIKQKNPDAFRILYISGLLISQILLHQRERKLNDNDFILAKFPGRKSVTQQSVDEMMRKDINRLKIKTIGGSHTWRHTRAIMLLDSGMNIAKLKSFLGHSSLKNTLIYLKYSNSDLKKSIYEANESIGL